MEVEKNPVKIDKRIWLEKYRPRTL